MNWGAGSGLGPLTVVGYLLFLAGVALMWRSRGDFFVWFHDGLSFFRRNFSRYTPAGPFYALREESRFKAIPVTFVRSMACFPRRRINGPAILLFLGFLLFVLDLFV
jgi:hypothetical protein